MKKTQLILGLLALVFILFSCVPPDPNAVYGLNNSNANGNITGPRIITKIDSANIVKTEYISSNSGVLQLVKNYNDPDDAIVYGNNNKISTITMDYQSTNRIKLMLNYDTSGRIVTSKQENYMNNGLHSVADCALTYNSSNKLIQVLKKTKLDLVNNQYTHYDIIDIFYSGENVIKVKVSPGVIINGVMEPVEPNLIQNYLFEDFDGKINPYTTLPKEYNIGMGLLASPTFGSLSYNNHLKFTIQMSPTFPPIVTQGPGFIYDPQNYPISDVQNVRKIYYKPLQ